MGIYLAGFANVSPLRGREYRARWIIIASGNSNKLHPLICTKRKENLELPKLSKGKAAQFLTEALGFLFDVEVQNNR